LKDVNLSIKKGEFIGVYGDVGSGKSSLLYSMAKLLPYYTGSVTVSEEASLH
jgi:energy-coupling factor transporter ATP-binding protein EcfA2